MIKFMHLLEILKFSPPNGTRALFLFRFLFAYPACSLQHILEKQPYSYPYSSPKGDVDEKVDNVEEPVPAVDKNTNESTQGNIIGKPLNDRMWNDENEVTNCKN